MGKKANKATKKFASSGQLKKTIQARQKRQQIRRKVEARQGTKKLKKSAVDQENENDEEDVDTQEMSGAKKRMTVDDFLNGNFMDDDDDEIEGGDEEDEEDSGSEEDEDVDMDAESFASVDELDEQDGLYMQELSQLAEKDPEFYKYLQENDRELLDFNPESKLEESDNESVGEDDAMEDAQIPRLTNVQLQNWQKALLETHSLKALRKLLIAFRAAAHMNEDKQVFAWSIDNSSVYTKLVNTALVYTPIILGHHIPYKTLANGKIKPPTQTPKFKTLQKLIISYFHNIMHILPQLTDKDILRLALNESSKLIPYVLSSRKTIKMYLKHCLELWATADDSVRIAAFLGIRKLASTPDKSIIDNVFKATYLTLIRSSKSTSTYTLPSINLMKNSASEVFCVDHATTYQHAFGYIRQLAIHLRNSMKIKTKEAYKQVYNWQYIHCVDFWCIVLARACDKKTELENGKESELRPLIYPLVQVSLGSIKLIPNSRSHPFHLHIIRSLLHLTSHTETYVPLSPYLIPILTSVLSPSARPKSSTLRPLDLEVQIRVPQQYLKTRVYSEGITEESVFTLAEWLASPCVHGSIAFPEIIVPISVLLRKHIKSARTGTTKEQGLIKTLLERLEDTSRWMETKRKGVSFAPGKLADVAEWENKIKDNLADSPLNKYLKVQRKAREKRRQLLDKARDDQHEIIEE